MFLFSAILFLISLSSCEQVEVSYWVVSYFWHFFIVFCTNVEVDVLFLFVLSSMHPSGQLVSPGTAFFVAI